MWEFGWEAQLTVAGQVVTWISDGKEHHVEWPTPDAAVGIFIGGAPDDAQYAWGRVRGLHVQIHSVQWTDSLERETRAWLADPDHARLLEQLPLDGGEAVHFGWPDSSASVRDRGPDIDLRRVAQIITVSNATRDPSSVWVQEVNRKATERLRWSDLPEDLRDLAPLARRWGIGDDAIRSDQMDRARTATLLSLTEKVLPRLTRINNYLDEVQDDPSEAALRLQRLAEAALEAELDLGRREIMQEQ